MAGYLTDFANNLILDSLFGGKAALSPPMLYFGLSRSPASKLGRVSEPDGVGYARAAVPNDTLTFAVATGGTKHNLSPIAFPFPSGDWGPIASVFIADAPTGGNVLAMADLQAPKLIGLGGLVPPTIAAGALFLSHT